MGAACKRYTRIARWIPIPAVWTLATPPGRPLLWGTPPPGSAPPNTDDADVGNLLVDEVGHAEPRWQLVLEQLDAGDERAPRPRWAVRHPGEQFLGDGRAIRRRERIEVRLGRVGQEDSPGHAERR